MLEPHRIRHDFPIFEGARDGAADHFLDSAASSQKPDVVLEAMSRFASTTYANVHRGAYRLSLEATERYELARRRAGEFIGAATPEEVVLNRGATTGLNQVAFGWGLRHLRPGRRVLVSTMEHHANLVPWQMVTKRTGASLEPIPTTEDGRFDEGAFHALLDDDVSLVAVTGMSNVLGTIPPLQRIVEAAHDVDAIVVVDGAQLVPHRPVDVHAVGADFLAFSAHKMLGPTGIGVLWGRPDRLDEMEPLEGGGEMIADVTFDSATWASVPHRFEAGTPPIIEAVGLTAAIDYLDKLTMSEVATHDRHLTAVALERLRRIDDLTVHGPPSPTTEDDRGGVISFTLGDVHPHDVATILDEQGVSVRAGHHCAKPLIRELGVPATARASFSVYNDESDIDALVDGLETARRLFGL